MHIYTRTNLSTFIYIYLAKYGSNAYNNVTDVSDDDWDETDETYIYIHTYICIQI
jgi:hypothetical protein